MNLPQQLNWSLGIELITCWHVQIVNKINKYLTSRQSKYILGLLINPRFNIPLNTCSIGVAIKIDIRV